MKAGRTKKKMKTVHAGIAAGLVLGAGVAFSLTQNAPAQTPVGRVGPSPSTSPSANASPSASPTTASQPTRDVYIANLTPLNTNSSVGITPATGSARVVVDGGRIGVDLQANGLVTGATVTPAIRTGSNCPTLAEDTNGDGFVDAQEAQSSWGSVLVPLNLNGVLSPGGRNTVLPSGAFPLANSSGGVLNFINSGPFAPIAALLNAAPVSPAPSPSATSSSSPLPSPSASASASPSASPAAGQAAGYTSLQGLVVEISGVGNTALPSSVSSLGGADAAQTLPVACGTLQKQTE